jgi:nicotinamidase-related amidase
MKTCLIVIDAQESFRYRPYYTEHDVLAYLSAQNALIEGCMASGVPVVGSSKRLKVWQIFKPQPHSTKTATARWWAPG